MNTAEQLGARDLDPPEAQRLRGRLVAHLVDLGDVQSDRVRQALLRVPRHLFVPSGTSLEDAYSNRPLPIGQGQTISQPSVVALMTEALELTGDERVLEIGTGSGYQAAVLSGLVQEVDSVEVFVALAEASAGRLAALGYANVHVLHGNGSLGWSARAPFERILATAAAPAPPRAWLDQLVDGGILVAPMSGSWGQQLVRLRKRHGGLARENLGGVAFVPLLPWSRRAAGAPPTSA